MDTTINKFLITIVAFIYDGIGTLYEIFLRLAKANLFNDSDNVLSGFIRRLYVIIGVVMLFFLAYSLLRTIVNPNAKDKNSIGKIIGNVVKAIVIIAIVPAAFDLAFEIQESIMKKNTIGKIILGVSNTGDVEGAQYLAEGETVSDVVNNAGVDLSTTIFSAFFYPYISEEALNDSKYKLCENETKISVEECQMNNFQYGKYKYIELSDEVKKNGNFSVYKNFAEVVNNESEDEYIVFNWVFALIAGGFCLWIMITYTLSLALRIIKLAYYEIIAPIPAIADIVPGQQGMFKKWLKAAAGTFVEALVRVAILFFCVYIIRIICSVWSSNNDFFAGAGPVTKKLLQALLIMGVITFMSKAPELISEIFGGNGGKYGFGLKDLKEKLAAGGFFSAGAVAGGAATSFVRNAVNSGFTAKRAFKKAADATDSKEKRSAIWQGVSSAAMLLPRAAAGFVSGGIRSFGKDPKDFKSMREQAHKGATGAGEKASERARYKAQHGGIFGSAFGHVKDTVRKVGDWAGFNNIEEITAENKKFDEISAKKKAVRTAAEGFVEKELSKGRSDFEIDGLTITDLKAKKVAMEQAQASGAADYGTKLADYQTAFKKMTDKLQNQVLISDKSWEALLNNKATREFAANLSDIRQSAIEFRSILEKNLTNRAVSAAGFNKENVIADIDITLDGAPYKNLGTELDILKTANINKIEQMRKEREDSEKKK